MANQIKTSKELFEIARRRKWSIIIPTAGALLTATTMALLIPRQYRSTATIQIQSQLMPNEYVKANISSYADHRVQALNHRIVGDSQLLGLISRFHLYEELKGRLTPELILEKMRSDIKLAQVDAGLEESRSGSQAQSTIAFSITYRGARAKVVQQVANELAKLCLAENVNERKAQSTTNYKFLQDEMLTSQQKLSALDAKLAAFKQRNLGALPEQVQVNVQSYQEAERQIGILTAQLSSAQEKEGALQSMLGNVPAELNTGDREALRQLNLKLADLRTRFTEQHPDVRKAEQDVAELQRVMQQTSSGGKPDNPAYVTLASQLAGTRSDIKALRHQIAQMTARRDSYQRMAQLAPRVEEGYKAILVERDNMQKMHDDLAKKAMEANVALGMEKEQLGERFTLLDPARLPDKPATPNVSAILLLGTLLGLFSGVGLAALRERSDTSLHVAEDLAVLTGISVLATIPDIVTASDLRRNRLRLVMAASIVVAVIAVAAWGALGHLSGEEFFKLAAAIGITAIR